MKIEIETLIAHIKEAREFINQGLNDSAIAELNGCIQALLADKESTSDSTAFKKAVVRYPTIICPFCLNKNNSATQYCDVCKNYGRVQILPLK